MAETAITRSISTHFTGLADGVVVPSIAQLSKEVRSSTISIALNKMVKDGDALHIYFADAIATAEETLLDQLIAAHTGVGLTDPTTATGARKVHVEDGTISLKPPNGSEAIIGAPDFADPTTWWQRSARVTETLVAVAGTNNLQWQSPTGRVNWIDAVHGLWLDQDAVPPGYDVQLPAGTTAAAPFEEEKWQGEDCWINYAAGRLVYQSAPATAPTVTYSYATTSEFTFAPNPGKRLNVEKVTAQFSVGANLRGAFQFKIQASNGQGGWVDLGGKTYHTKRQILQDALGSFPTLKATTPDPAVAGIYERGHSDDIEEIPFRYAYSRPLMSSLGMRMYLRIENDQPVLGDSALVTFYCNSEDES